MLLAIDVGNTDTKFGVSDGKEWVAIWRRPTRDRANAAVLFQWLNSCLAGAKISLDRGLIEAVACVSVVPARDTAINSLSRRLCGKSAFFLRIEGGEYQGLKIEYEPPGSLGADRLANVIGAIKHFYPAPGNPCTLSDVSVQPPLIVVDFGSATTFDVVKGDSFVGGAILPGVRAQAESLFIRTAQLPEVPLSVPASALGKSTIAGLQSGIVLGHIGAVEGLINRMQQELGSPATVVATGGLSHFFISATPCIQHFVPTLTLDGVAVAYRGRMT